MFYAKLQTKNNPVYKTQFKFSFFLEEAKDESDESDNEELNKPSFVQKKSKSKPDMAIRRKQLRAQSKKITDQIKKKKQQFKKKKPGKTKA